MRNIILTLDTETADLTGNVYDIGWIIHTRSGEVLAEYNSLVIENFTNPDIMMGAFYAKKLFSHYAPMLERQEIAMAAWSTIIERLRSDIAEYNVKTIAAYNIGFDMRAIANTHKALGNQDKVLQSKVQVLDIWQYACEAKLNTDKYRNTCKALGWVSPAGNVKTGAEFAYRFCIGDHGFIEDHTALSDCVIEVEILRQCFKTKKKIPYGKYNQAPWRIVQRKPVEGDADIHGSVTA